MVSWDEIFVTNITLIGFLPSRYKAMDFQIARMSKNSVTYFTLITFIPVVYHIVLHICTYAYITWRAILNHMLISCTFRLALCAYGCIVDDSSYALDGMCTSKLLYHVCGHLHAVVHSVILGWDVHIRTTIPCLSF
jgi:hypothetical protein